MQSQSTLRLAQKLTESHLRTNSWRITCAALGIVTESEKPDPGLAQKIANGYEPTGPALRLRIGLKPLPGTFVKPAWVKQAVKNLKTLERKAALSRKIGER